MASKNIHIPNPWKAMNDTWYKAGGDAKWPKKPSMNPTTGPPIQLAKPKKKLRKKR